jgi:psiF repeat
MEKTMKKLLAAVVMAMPLLSVPAFAANAQQNKMVSCNKDATGKKGDERKAFMKECLSNKPLVAAPAPTQQQKMVTCNKDATGKKGDERKAFMKQCLSNKT